MCSIFKLSLEKVNNFTKYLGNKVYVILILVLVTSLVDGLGILLLVPVLQSDLGESQGVLASIISFLNDFIILIFGETKTEYLILLIAILFILKGLFNFKALSYSSKLRAELIVKLKKKIFISFQKINYTYYARQEIGEMTNLLNDHVTKALQSFHFFTLMMIQLANLIISLGICLFLSPVFGFVVIIVGMIIQILFKALNARVLVYAQDALEANDKLMGRFLEFLNNFKYMLTTNNINAFDKEVDSGIERLRRNQFKLGNIESVTQSLREPVAMTIMSLVIVIHMMLFDGELAPILVSIILLYRAMNAVVQLQSFRQTFLNNYVSFDFIDKKIKEMSESVEITKGCSNLLDVRAIQLNNVGFGFTKEKNVLDNIEFVIEPKSTTAIIGQSGSGKSTLLELIALLREYTEGDIFLGDTPFSQVDKSMWRSSLGYVGQENSIFEDTLANNITLNIGQEQRYSDEEEQEIRDVLKKSGLNDFVDSQAEGIYTRLHYTGRNISGGQRQRVMIARELFRKPSLLIMDEATSALDAKTEKLVNETIAELKGTVTLIIVAHKMSSIKNVDNVIVLEKGKISEKGKYSDLIADQKSKLNSFHIA